MKCENMVDKHVEAFEMGDGRILDIDCEYVTRQCFSCSNNVQSKPPLWSSHVNGLVLFATIVGVGECLNQICAKEGWFHLWLCGNCKDISNKSL